MYAIATADGTAQLGAYAYNRLLELQFAATRSIDIEGRSSIEYAYQVVTNLPRSPGQTARDFQQLLDSCTPAEAARLQQLMQLPSTSYQSTRLCVQPRNFQVQVIKSLRLYNFASFLADLGQSWRANERSAERSSIAVPAERPLIMFLLLSFALLC